MTEKFDNATIGHGTIIEDDGTTVLSVNEEGILLRERKDQPD